MINTDTITLSTIDGKLGRACTVMATRDGVHLPSDNVDRLTTPADNTLKRCVRLRMEYAAIIIQK